MPVLVRLSAYMNILIPSSLKTHQASVQLLGGADPAGWATAEGACADVDSSASAPCKHPFWAKHELWNLGVDLPVW